MFSIVNNFLDYSSFENALYRQDAGGIVTFQGRVRNHNNGRSVLHLNYEAYDEMAMSEGLKIIKEAKEKFAILEAQAIHRIGDLQIEEAAIWVGVSAAHRHAAFLACQYIVDQIKSRVPIWKKEYYVDGESEWVKCLTCSKKGIPHTEHQHFHHQSTDMIT